MSKFRILEFLRMSIDNERKVNYPGNLGCTFGNSTGEMCAVLGCQAKLLIEELRDKGVGAIARIDKVKSDAIQVGCSHFRNDQINQ